MPGMNLFDKFDCCCADGSKARYPCGGSCATVAYNSCCPDSEFNFYKVYGPASFPNEYYAGNFPPLDNSRAPQTFCERLSPWAERTTPEQADPYLNNSLAVCYLLHFVGNNTWERLHNFGGVSCELVLGDYVHPPDYTSYPCDLEQAARYIKKFSITNGDDEFIYECRKGRPYINKRPTTLCFDGYRLGCGIPWSIAPAQYSRVSIYPQNCETPTVTTTVTGSENEDPSTATPLYGFCTCVNRTKVSQSEIYFTRDGNCIHTRFHHVDPDINDCPAANDTGDGWIENTHDRLETFVDFGAVEGTVWSPSWVPDISFLYVGGSSGGSIPENDRGWTANARQTGECLNKNPFGGFVFLEGTSSATIGGNEVGGGHGVPGYNDICGGTTEVLIEW